MRQHKKKREREKEKKKRRAGEASGRAVGTGQADTRADGKASRKMNGNTKKAQGGQGGAKFNREMVRVKEQAKRNEQGSKDRGTGHRDMDMDRYIK